jgi:hypothetical protein
MMFSPRFGGFVVVCFWAPVQGAAQGKTRRDRRSSVPPCPHGPFRPISQSPCWWIPKKFQVWNPQLQVRNPEFRIENSQFHVWDSEFRIEDMKFHVWNLEFLAWNSQFQVVNPEFQSIG